MYTQRVFLIHPGSKVITFAPATVIPENTLGKWLFVLIPMLSAGLCV